MIFITKLFVIVNDWEKSNAQQQGAGKLNYGLPTQLNIMQPSKVVRCGTTTVETVGNFLQS